MTKKGGAVCSGRKVRVCFVGQDNWVRKLAETLSRHASRLDATHVGVSNGPLVKGLLRFCKADIVVRVGLRPGARTVRGVAFDSLWTLACFLKPRCLVVCYWIGTDVLRAVQDAQRNRLTRFWGLALRWSHIAAAPWLAEELREAMGVDAKTVLFPLPLPRADPPPLPPDFRVLTYIPDRRYDFYGGDMVYAAARELPTVLFSVVGGVGNWVDRPLPNLRFYGWCENMLSMYAGSSVVVRLVRHDAIGGTVREGLALGRHVVYNYMVPYTRYVKYGDTDALIRVLSEYEQLHRRGELGLNKDGMEFAIREWSEARLVNRLEAVLLDMMGEDCDGRDDLS